MPKPFDQIFKAIAEGDPRGLLDLFGSVPLEVDAKVEIVERELTSEPLYVDQAYRVETKEGTWIEHFEVTARVPSDLNDRFAKYGFVLAMAHRLPVKSTLILLSRRHAPNVIDPVHRLNLGTVKIEVEFRVIRLWTLDGGKILAENRPRLLPFVPMVESTGEQVAEAAQRIMETGDGSLRAAFRMLGGLRFGMNDWKLILERLPAMWWTEQIARDSSMYDIVLDMGIEKGVRKGRIATLRGDIRKCLKLRFPSIGPLRELDTISDKATLDRLFRGAVLAPKPESFLALMRRHCPKAAVQQKRERRS
jgi:hypothetical protein